MPLPFRRKSSDLVSDALASSGAASAGATSDETAPKGRTPSKRERGVVTPKRTAAGRRTPEPPPANRREAYKRMRERDKTEREERRRAMLAGDERFMLARDKGPERALVRDIVDHRMTVGTWFFAGALVVLVGSSAAMPPAVRVASNLLWAALAAATGVDSYLICRKIKKLVRARFPKTEQRLGSLYFYGIMRGITFRRLRMPRPRIKLGEEY